MSKQPIEEVNWGKIKKEYIENCKTVKLKYLAEKYGVKPGTLRSRKNREKWDDDIKGRGGSVAAKSATQRKNGKSVATKKEQNTKGEKGAQREGFGFSIDDIENAELNEMQRLFCLYYIKSFNATQAAIKAGYSKSTAHVQGPRLLGHVRIREEIRRLKGIMHEELLIDAMDVLAKYIKIAFSDTSEYVTFGQKQVQVMTMYGPLYEEEGEGKNKTKKPVMKTVNYIDFIDSTKIDGSIITEVAQGREGVKIKFADKMKALEKLELYFDLLPDKWKRRLEEEKLALEKQKLEGVDPESEKAKTREAIDNFTRALGPAAEDVWTDDGNRDDSSETKE